MRVPVRGVAVRFFVLCCLGSWLSGNASARDNVLLEDEIGTATMEFRQLPYMAPLKNYPLYGRDELRERFDSLCGVISLLYVLRSHDIPVSFSELRKHFTVTEPGVSVRQIRDVAKRFGLEARGVKAKNLRSLHRFGFPCIMLSKAEPDTGRLHFWILLGVDKEEIWAIDYLRIVAFGPPLRQEWKDVKDQWTGVAVVFWPGSHSPSESEKVR